MRVRLVSFGHGRVDSRDPRSSPRFTPVTPVTVKPHFPGGLPELRFRKYCGGLNQEEQLLVTTGTPSGQQALFDDSTLRPLPADIGYRGPVACAAAGITYRQLDYWARTGLLEPSVRPAAGSGSQRLYGFRDILILRIVKRLIDTGVSLQNIRAAVEHLHDREGDDLSKITIMSDGASIYECRSADEVVDLVRGGQGVFGIAVGSVWREVEGNLAELPGEQADGSAILPLLASDELASRRARRVAG